MFRRKQQSVEAQLANMSERYQRLADRVDEMELGRYHDQNVERLELAIKNESPVAFFYPQGEVLPGGPDAWQERTVSPWELRSCKNGRVVLLGWDSEKDAVRTFRLDRIQGVRREVQGYVRPTQEAEARS